MIFITFAILLLMASIEAGLAYMREVLLQDELATSSLLRGDAALACQSGTCGSPRRRRWAWDSFCRLRWCSLPFRSRHSFIRCAP